MLSLSDENGQPRYYADDVRTFLKDNNSQLFTVKDLSTVTVLFWYLGSVVLGGLIFFGLAICVFKKSDADKDIEAVFAELSILRE